MLASRLAAPTSHADEDSEGRSDVSGVAVHAHGLLNTINGESAHCFGAAHRRARSVLPGDVSKFSATFQKLGNWKGVS